MSRGSSSHWNVSLEFHPAKRLKITDLVHLFMGSKVCDKVVLTFKPRVDGLDGINGAGAKFLQP